MTKLCCPGNSTPMFKIFITITLRLHRRLTFRRTLLTLFNVVYICLIKLLVITSHPPPPLQKKKGGGKELHWRCLGVNLSVRPSVRLYVRRSVCSFIVRARSQKLPNLFCSNFTDRLNI